MSLLYERTDDYVLTISDAGQAAYEAEQHANRRRAEIRVGTIAAALLCIAVLVITKILGS